MKKIRLNATLGDFLQGKKRRAEILGPEIKLIFQSNIPEKWKVVCKDPHGKDIRCFSWRVNHEGAMKWFRSASKVLVRDLAEFVVPMETTTLTAMRFSHGSLRCPIRVWYGAKVNGNQPGAYRLGSF